MVKGLYCIRDKKANYCMDVQTYRTDDEALRMFELAAKTEESFICKFPSHFELYRIGDYNEASGVITSVDPYIVCSGNDFARKEVVDA